MKLSRADKEAIVDDLVDHIEDHQVVGILDMHSLPAKQLQEIKKELVGDADITMARKSLMEIALDEADKDNIQDLKANKAIQPAFIFSDSNPFTLYQTIQEKKSSAPAQGGEIAPNDIVIEEGQTDLGPGPMIGKLQSLGAQTTVEDGSIKVTDAGVAVEEGEVIDAETADILSKLGMKPLEVGLDLKLVHEKGEVFDKDVLAIDTEQYRSDVETSAAQAFQLAVNAGYLTPETAEPIVVEELQKARNLAVNAALPAKEVIEDILAKATGEAQALESQLDLEAQDVEEDDDEQTDDTNDETSSEDEETSDDDDE
ncbi:MAG: 50S ribosomal protein L10 [Candidatus Nanohaloarchaeota archaeon QJJ-5]|nr:50S ribosomal protein L10 [Candidatus Nanohaloarchaeota archaeon QJJ-5]